VSGRNAPAPAALTRSLGATE